MGALTVYLTARDALQAAGVLQPDYSVAERETYHFVADDGSVFVVWPAGWLSSAKREFVAGPRKGRTENITNAQVEQYRKQAEEEWGKYTPGSLLSGPRFIPGTKRKSLPVSSRISLPNGALETLITHGPGFGEHASLYAGRWRTRRRLFRTQVSPVLMLSPVSFSCWVKTTVQLAGLPSPGSCLLAPPRFVC
jgi:hypothetical protein